MRVPQGRCDDLEGTTEKADPVFTKENAHHQADTEDAAGHCG
jgi:hypothetical protein